MSEGGELRKNLFYFSLFSGMTGSYLAMSADSSLQWTFRTGSLVVSALMFYVALTVYRDLVELYQEQAGSESSSSGREVIPVEVKP